MYNVDKVVSAYCQWTQWKKTYSDFLLIYIGQAGFAINSLRWQNYDSKKIILDLTITWIKFVKAFIVNNVIYFCDFATMLIYIFIKPLNEFCWSNHSKTI